MSGNDRIGEVENAVFIPSHAANLCRSQEGQCTGRFQRTVNAVTQIDDLLDATSLDIFQDASKRPGIAVDIRDDRDSG